MDIDFEYLQHASLSFLTQEIPDNWLEMKEQEQNRFLVNHVWEPLESWDAVELWSSIEGSARHWKKFVEEKLKQ